MKTSGQLRRAFVLMTLLFSMYASADDKLFMYAGKTYSSADLTPDLKQGLYELDHQRFEGMKQAIDAALLDVYIQGKVKADKKSESEVRSKLFGIKPVTEKEAEEWFKQNQARLGDHKFDKIKKDVMTYLNSQREAEARDGVLKKIKAEGKFSLALVEPVAPQIEISTKGFPASGPEGAKVEIIEFADYQCPHCSHAADSLKKVLDQYGKQVRFVYIDFPINRSGVSRVVAEGGVCAEEQGKYWEYHYLAFKEQRSLTNDSPVAFAKNLKLDDKKFSKCLEAKKTKEAIELAKKEGERVGVQGTPTIFINGRRQHGYAEETLIQEIKKYL